MSAVGAGGPAARGGHLYGVGVGPGSPELLTLRAARLVATADVVAYHAGRRGSSQARRIVAAAGLLRADVVEEELVYPVTTGTIRHEAGYYGALAEFYDACAERLATHLDAGRSVVVLALGDPLFYGSFMYVHDALRPHHPVTVVPGVTAVSAVTAAAGTNLCLHEDTLTVLPGTLPTAELARRLADTDAAVVLKLGRTFPAVREALRQAGVLERAVYVEHASTPRERVLPVTKVDEADVPYLSMVVVPGQDLRSDAAGRAGVEEQHAASPVAPRAGRAPGTVHVVGLGPGGAGWTTPETTGLLERVAHVVGYAPYLARVPQRPGLTRHASGNTVELDRARLALDLARAGEDVAVVSGGDPGVFGMAAAVLEAAADVGDDGDAPVPVRVHPGVTAAHAASARVGAVLGGDHALVNLSDNLKPFEVLVDRLVAMAERDVVVACYNPRSRSRPDTLGDVRDRLVERVGPDRTVVVARNVGRDGESVEVTTLGGLDVGTVDMACLVVVGASTTRVTPDGQVWTPRGVG
ncbi:precorrin-2 C(20)-methyltransferase [Ornithinimicrobium pratense]|uniref:precorrin-2 C(20)-methyltransferase n=1 Tax=Ornithinimicrobium pratense TaxID=2593973 RepID=UPI001EE1B323|nr:precorrin-2 C(20)-methyltransferase [Ornithinimicrobium pratense]